MSKVQRYYREMRVAWMHLAAAGDVRPNLHEVLPRGKVERMFSDAATEIATHPLADKVLTAMEGVRRSFSDCTLNYDCLDERSWRQARIRECLDVLAGYQYVTAAQPVDISHLPQGQQEIIAVVREATGRFTTEKVIGAVAKLTGAEPSLGVTKQYLAELTRNAWLTNDKKNGYRPGPKLGPRLGPTD